MAQCLVALQAPPGPDQQPEPLSRRSRTSLAVIDAIREAANSIANGIPSSRRQISTTAAASSASASEKPEATALGAFDEQFHRGRVDSRTDVQ